MHSELKRIVPGAKSAVLFVHGINATPRFFDEYAAALPADFSVHNLLLPGQKYSMAHQGTSAAVQSVPTMGIPCAKHPCRRCHLHTDRLPE